MGPFDKYKSVFVSCLHQHLEGNIFIVLVLARLEELWEITPYTQI